jgi:hypothetical protein
MHFCPESVISTMQRASVPRLREACAIVVLLGLCAACGGTLSGDDSAPAASIRIDTRTPTTLADSDMVVMHASVLDATGALLPRAIVTWTSGTPKTIDVSSDGHLHGHVATSNFCCDGAGSWGREAKITAAVPSNPLIADTTIAYVMRYATMVALKPNGVTSKTFPQVASLAPGDSTLVHATGFVYGPFFRDIPSYDSLSVDQVLLWTSRSPQIATMDRRGMVTGRSTGTATIVVQARGGLALDSGFVVVR